MDQSKRFTELNLGLVATLAGLNNDAIPECESAKVALYPNPAHDVVTIWADDGLMSVMVFDLFGQLVDLWNTYGDTSLRINTSDYSSGVYMVKVVTKTDVVTKQLIVR